MAFAGRSPTHTYPGPRSPTKTLHGYSEPQTVSSMYGAHRPMLPPSPQHYQPRFPATTIPTSTSSMTSLFDSRTNLPPYKRPDSSMSISSMLGGDPDRSHTELPSLLHSRTASHSASVNGPQTAAANTFMFPPHFPTKPGQHEYSYKPRSRTPDRLDTSFTPGPTRQRSSSSGMAMQRPGILEEPRHRSTASTPIAGLHDPFVTPFGTREDERTRRTSLSGLLQRPSSQPQTGAPFAPISEPYHGSIPPAIPYDRDPPPEPPKQNGTGGTYDTKPPGMNGHAKSVGTSTVSPSKPLFNSVSPELRRPSLNGSQSRGFINILNGPTSQPVESPSATSQRMVRQDSLQSHSDRSVFGERTKLRAYSPFNSSFTSNPDELGRKGSDDLSQHRAILGLAQDNKRGRYSPLPQAVQGAQAQSPVPDGAAKADRGRVFSGIGGGLRTTPTPSSPFKRDEVPLKISEDNLKTLSRGASGSNKRPRKNQDDERQGSVSAALGEKANGRKRGKHQHNYKADLEEAAQTGFLPQRNSSAAGLNAFKRVPSPAVESGTVEHYQARNFSTTTPIRYRKVIHVSGVFDAVSRLPRRHLGTFTYRPKIALAEGDRANRQKFNISITPNLLPSFTDPDNLNCTYTVHVPRLWLQSREQGLISAEHHVWGSGIYTDDSDPVAAAMHAGFLKAKFDDNVDTNLLAKIIQERNPRVEYPKYVRIPPQPLDVVEKKDLKITLVVLPLLERYEGSNGHGIRSRSWPAVGAKTPHDGVSFGILNVEFVNRGTEEMRMGRTGQDRRERRRIELEGRRRDLQQQRQKIAAAKHKRVELLLKKKKKQTVRNGRGGSLVSIPKSVPATTVLGRQPAQPGPSGVQAYPVPALA